MPDATTLPAASLALFLAYAKDAGNWSGTPLVGGNVSHGLTENGYLTDLKKRGLVTTFRSEGDAWLEFTEAGKILAGVHGIQLLAKMETQQQWSAMLQTPGVHNPQELHVTAHNESEAWTVARAACTPGQRVLSVEPVEA